jgi:hydrogenase maturation protein HypF
MADSGLDERVIGVAFDGTGYGPDGAIWGGEFLVGDYAGVERVAHLRYVAMPGGEQATREPWRMAVSHMVDAGEPLDIIAAAGVEEGPLSRIVELIRRGVRSPPTSSVGRLFDAVAAITNVRLRATYEAQAPMELEGLGSTVPDDTAYPVVLEEISTSSPVIVDTRPIVSAICADVRRGTSVARVSRRFHSTIVRLVESVCVLVRERTGLATVVLTGGVFQNAILSTGVEARLCGLGFRVYRHRRVPPNDGGLCLGQLAIANRLCSARA